MNKRTIYHWMDINTGEIRTTTWDLIKYAVSEFLFCVRHGYPIIPRKWKYNKKGLLTGGYNESVS